MTPLPRAVAALATAGVLMLAAGCGSDSGSGGGSEAEKDKDAGEHFTGVADQTTCVADADPVERPWPDAFPTDWPFPGGTTAYHVEDRDADGVIVTAVTDSAFRDVLSFMNHEVVDAGFEVESGETEEHDAEAEWAGNGFRGRWAIRESSQCPGETVLQVLSTR
jgi:hypothetical protein